VFLKPELLKAAFHSLGLSHHSYINVHHMMIHCCWHNEITLVLILRQLNPVHNLQAVWLSFILILSSHLHQVWPGGLFPSDLPTKTVCTFPKSPMHATWLIKLILILIKCGTICKAWNSSVCTFIKLPVTCPPPRIKIFSSAPRPKHPHWIFFPHWQINFHTHTNIYKKFHISDLWQGFLNLMVTKTSCI